MYFSIYELSVDKINHIYVEIEIEIKQFSHKHINLKMSSVKLQP